jgi:hypothetical protein
MCVSIVKFFQEPETDIQFITEIMWACIGHTRERYSFIKNILPLKSEDVR